MTIEDAIKVERIQLVLCFKGLPYSSNNDAPYKNHFHRALPVGLIKEFATKSS